MLSTALPSKVIGALVWTHGHVLAAHELGLSEMTTLLPQSGQGGSSNMPAENNMQQSSKPCSHCAARLIELKRQAMKIMMIEYHKSTLLNTASPSVGSLFIAVYEQLRLPDDFQAGLEREQCESCSTHVEILKREAVLSLHTVSIAPFLPKNIIPSAMSKSDQTPLSLTNRTRVASTSVGGGTGGSSACDGEKHESTEARRTSAMAATPVKVSTSTTETPSPKRSSIQHVKDVQQQQPAPAAAIFFAKAAKNFNIPAKKKTRKSNNHYQKQPYDMATNEDDDVKQLFPTNFSYCLSRNPAANPPGLFKYMGRRVDGKVKIMLRIAASPSDNGSSVPFLRVDQRRKQVTLPEPRDAADNPMKSLGFTPTAPKIFGFDAIFESSATKTEICSAALLDVIHAVINGGDGCLLVYGATGLGKTDTMIGKDLNAQSLGVIPCAISWLYNLIDDSKQRTGARFSVRVSGVEIVGRSENLKDLLSEQASGGSSTSSNGTSPGIYLREDPIGGVQLSNLSELRAPTADKASFYLDAALAARTSVPATSKESLDISEHQGSHMIFTLHVYQYRIDKTGRGGVHGGRSRLHLIDLSAWPKNAFKDGLCHSAPAQIALGKIILSMLNGTKQVAYKDSKIARLLKDSIGNPACRTTIINHVSPEEDRYTESLATLEMASKISRSRRRKNKYCSASSSGGESSCDEAGRLSRRLPRPPAVRTCGIDIAPKFEPSDCTSSAGEESCDTVIYVGPNGRLSDQDLTDNESPPVNESLSAEEFVLSDCENRPSSPRFGPKSANSVKSRVSSGAKVSDFVLSDCDVDRPSSPRFGPRTVPESTSKSFEHTTSNTDIAAKLSICAEEADGQTPTPEPVKETFIMSDCEDGQRSSSPSFGPRIRPNRADPQLVEDCENNKLLSVEPNEHLVNGELATTSDKVSFDTAMRDDEMERGIEEFQKDSSEMNVQLIEDDANEHTCEEDETMEDNAEKDHVEIKEDDTKEDFDIKEDDSKEDVIEVYVEEDHHTTNDVQEPVDEPNVELDQQKQIHGRVILSDDAKRKILTEIIMRTRSKLDYFKHEPDEEDFSYLNMGPVTEKELRKSEKRIKKLLKGVGLSNLRQRERAETDASCMSEGETDNTRIITNTRSGKESSGYSSAPETENRRRRLQKLMTRTIDSVDNNNQTAQPCSREGRPAMRSASPEKRLSAEETRSILKDFVAKKMIERAVSPPTSADTTSQSKVSDFIDNDESLTPSAVARIKYIPTGKANITSTKLCRGSVSSIPSTEASLSSPATSDRVSLDGSYDKAETVSMASYADSEDRYGNVSDSPLCDGGARRRRSPIKIHYRWSTVFEEEEKSKNSGQKSSQNSSSKNRNSSGKDKKSKKTKKSEDEPKKGTAKSPKTKLKFGGKSPKLEPKNADKAKKSEQKSPACTPKSSSKNEIQRFKQTNVGNSYHSVSECSELSESSGIASNDTSSLSQQSIQGSTIASVRGELEAENQTPVTQRSRKWFFRRRSRSSGYVSDGNITDSSRVSSKSRGFFRSKSKLSTGHSSGYESMRTDGGMSNVSGAESACEMDGSGKRKKKRFLGFRRRSLSDLSKKGRSNRSYWIDNPIDDEHFEYKVYQIEDLENRIHSSSTPPTKSTIPTAKLLENHRQKISELIQQRSELETELDRAMTRLMLNKEQYKVKDWFYHAPKAEDKSVKFATIIPASQIPGLGNHDDGPEDLTEDIHLRRKWIRDTDSKYVRLAKAGGRKDLFIYREHKPSVDGAVKYPRVEWFDHDNAKDEAEDLEGSTYKSSFPEWYVHDEYKRYQQEDFTPSKEKKSLLGFDNMSVWKRDALEQDERRTKSSPEKLPFLAKSKNSQSKLKAKMKKENEQNIRFPAIPTIDEIKSKQGSDMGQLLSMKYQHDWLDELIKKQKTGENTKGKKNQRNDKKDKDGTEGYYQNAKQEPPQEKPLFKLSRFANVGPKTQTHRI
eukprot:gene17715-19486_t